ncbi:Inner membrane amino-acid ABC transporter permease protein YecS [Bremerella volcania]|uniref:Inner membrane amino-acid ABC transporter permease protein YecS n=1 Tax=Bremerella volcania TaxID=2527984 RepID=A0A518CD42_9BACT|nr:ectoine/hydroxyectoine ABC transporter permease subunit EhuC [Bremerella volcania]QDU77140.1 Inner membrane amino-acid ABC transporter permease protein YecS [Bremerella volcania]
MSNLPPPLDLLPFLLEGLWITVIITLGGCAVAIGMSVLFGVWSKSTDPILRWLSAIYITVFRGASALILLYWFYFAMPELTNIRLDAITTGILVLGANVGAYGAEVVRASLEAIPKGQYQAAAALNLSRWQTMRYVIFPQAILSMIPPFGNLMIELLKGTALVSTITVADLTLQGKFLRDDTHRSFEIFGLLLVIYFLLSMTITGVFRLLEHRHSQGRDYGGGN